MKKSLHYLIMSNHLSFQKSLLLSIKDTGLTLGQPKVLDYLNSQDGVVQKEIARACHIEPATITSVLLGMENKGLIERKQLNGNRRNLYVFLTDQGKSYAQRVEKEFDIIEEKALSGFSKKERELLESFMLRINKNIAENRYKEDI